MKYEELPIEYQKLALLRHVGESLDPSFTVDQRIKELKSSPVSSWFNWKNTPERGDFWCNVHNAKTFYDLPLIQLDSDKAIEKMPEELKRVVSPRKDIYNTGDVVCIIKSGSGFSPDEKGKFTQITEIGLKYYGKASGCKIADRLGNNKPGHLSNIVGTESFRLATSEERKKYLGDKQLKFTGYAFSPEIDALIEKRQKDVGNAPNASLYLESRYAGSAGGGFNWISTIEGHDFWDKTIIEKDFSSFYKEYPNHNIKDVAIHCTSGMDPVVSESFEWLLDESKPIQREEEPKRQEEKPTLFSVFAQDALSCRKKKLKEEEDRLFDEAVRSYETKYIKDPILRKEKQSDLQPHVEIKVKKKKVKPKLIYKHY